MEKQGVIAPEITPVKTAASDQEKAACDSTLSQQVAALDADFTHRARDAAAPKQQ